MRVEEISVGNRKVYLLLDTNGLPVESVAKYMKYLHNKENKRLREIENEKLTEYFQEL